MRQVLAIALALALLAATAGADAYFPAGATVMSASPERQELADDVSQTAAVSGDGRFVAFQTRATNLFAEDDPDSQGTDRLGGVFRRNVESGALELVAAGDIVSEADGSLIRTGARNPSISADGRFVSFSSAYALTATDFNGAVDVYVRDMSLAPSAPGAYELISALAYSQLDGADGLRPGAEIWPTTSMSADGNLIAFRTSVASSGAGPGGPMPAGQLLVRDRALQQTRLVTSQSSDGAPAGGAAGPVAISADGSAVAWTGSNADAQVPILNGEPYFDIDNYYLYKRIANGPAAPARRVTGLADLDDPGCPPTTTYVNDATAGGPCYGPLASTDAGASSIVSRQLAITGDGSRVFYVTPAFKRPSSFQSNIQDLFVSDMRTGVSRKVGTVELTREGASGDTLTTGNIDGVAVTPDGRWLAMTTSRTRFTGALLTFGGEGRAIADTREVYLADLQSNTLERVVTNYGGGDSSGDAGSQVSLSADGQRVAFTSNASNLFFGDANNRVDAFVAMRQVAAPVETPVPEPTIDPGQIAEPPPDPPTIRLRVSRGPRNLLVAAVTVPAAGRLVVRVRGRLPAAGGRQTPLRVFASAKARLKRKGTVRLRLPVRSGFRAPLRRFGALKASAQARFDPAAAGRDLAAARSVRLLPPSPQNGNKKRSS